MCEKSEVIRHKKRSSLISFLSPKNTTPKSPKGDLGDKKNALTFLSARLINQLKPVLLFNNRNRILFLRSVQNTNVVSTCGQRTKIYCRVLFSSASHLLCR